MSHCKGSCRRRYTAAVPETDRPQAGPNHPLRTRAGAVSDVGRRLVDVVMALLALVILAPVMLAIAMLIRRKAGSPVLFRQVRAGRDGVPFTILKFRTMEMRNATCCLNPGACIGIQMAPGARTHPRVEILRRTGLDELPQILNVLRGDMSFVGPRPLMIRYIPRYSALQRRRLEVRPGITGWAQVNGRTDVSWDEKLALDVWYVEHRSLALDMQILRTTVRTAISGSGYSQSGSDTGPEYLGSGVAPGICPATELPLDEAARLGQSFPA